MPGDDAHDIDGTAALQQSRLVGIVEVNVEPLPTWLWT
jgi:hypothetical protein